MVKLMPVLGGGVLYLPPLPIVGTDFDDTLFGTVNGDEMWGRKGNDFLFGGGGDDTLYGEQGNDSLYGQQGNDFLFGGDNNDFLSGGIGADHLDGGAGIDTADYSTSAAGVHVDLVTGLGTGGEAQGDTLVGIENINGSSFDDVLQGNDVANTLVGGAGNDTLNGGGGDDTLRGGVGADALDGGAGNDTVDYSASAAGVHVDFAAGTGADGDAEGDILTGIENLFGSSHDDTLQGDDVANVIKGGGGADHIEGRGGNDTLIGANESDVIDGGAGRDLILGQDGNDRLLGGNDDDEIHGGLGDDLIDGGHGADSLFGDQGIDTLSYASSTAGVNVNLDTGAVSGGYAFLDNIHNFENPIGSQFDDVLTGTDGIGFSTANGNGEAADNFIQGLGGNDQIFGSLGNDRIEGGTGNDILTGGGDGDAFIFQAVDQLPFSRIPAPPGDDVITDFQVGVDHMEFQGINTLYDLNFQEVNGNAVITYAHATGSITLTGVTLDSLLAHASHDLVLV